MKILFCSSEVSPFAKTGGLGEVCGTLPVALEKEGLDVAVMMPRYKEVDIKKYGLKKLNRDIYETKIGRSISVYFIENKKWFSGRDGLYGYDDKNYDDNFERFHFFCKKSLAAIKDLKLNIDIIHCHDWHSALIPVFLKASHGREAAYKSIKSILTVHNMAFQGIFPSEKFPELNLKRELSSVNGLEFYVQINFLKGGILFSDVVTTVSRNYAKEIQSSQFGQG